MRKISSLAMILVILMMMVASAAGQDKLGHLKQYLNQYPDDEFLNLAEIRAPLTKLLGNELKHFKQNMGVVTPMDFIQGHLVANGCMAHNCVYEKTILAINLTSGEMTVAILSDCQHITIFSEVTDKYEFLPVAVKKWVEESERDCRRKVNVKITLKK